MENKIKGGGGALTRNELIIKHDPTVNQEKTQKAQGESRFLKFFNWASTNGIIMPSLQFPVAFYDEGVIGVSCKIDIPTNKAFLFVPSSLILSASLARKSEISPLFSAHPYFFSGHPLADFDTLLIFLIYERSKSSQSKWSIYFDAISDIDLLLDWSDSELSQLQDPFLSFQAKEAQEKLEKKWESLQEVFNEHPDVFSQGTTLKEIFHWSFRVLTTRAIVNEEIQLIPMVDFINFDNHELVIENKDADMLQQLAEHPDGSVDYRDLLGSPTKGQGATEHYRYKTRLQKFIHKKTQNDSLKSLNAIWEIEGLLKEFFSSEDEEEIDVFQGRDEAADDDDYDEDEEEVEEEKYELIGKDFCVVSTDAYSGFKQGSQVLYQVKRLSNRDWLLQYGFCLENNWFDSFYLIFWAPSYGKTGLVTLGEIQAKVYQNEISGASLADVSELIVLKGHNLNTEVLKYFRKTIDYAKYNLSEPALKVSPSSVDLELVLVELALQMYTSIEEGFTPVAHDMNLLNRNLPKRMKYAFFYRISQKKIISAQKSMLVLLRGILMQFKESGCLEKHLTDKSIKGVKQVYPLIKYLKSFWVNIKNSARPNTQ